MLCLCMGWVTAKVNFNRPLAVHDCAQALVDAHEELKVVKKSMRVLMRSHKP